MRALAKEVWELRVRGREGGEGGGEGKGSVLVSVAPLRWEGTAKAALKALANNASACPVLRCGMQRT